VITSQEEDKIFTGSPAPIIFVVSDRMRSYCTP